MVTRPLRAVLHQICGLAAASAADGLSDGELLRRFCASRDETAFTALLHRHGRMVWGVCRDVLGHEQDAEDAFQATFLALARQASSIRSGQAVAAWLHGTARRIALAARRAAATRRAHEQRWRKTPLEKPLSEEELREALGLLDDEVQGLPERQRAVFVLCALDGKSRAEASRVLGWKEGTVASTLARARERLQRRLTRRGVTLTSALCAVALVRQAKAVAPAILARSTIRAAVSYAAGNEVTDIVSKAVVELAKGAATTMMSTQLKTTMVLLLPLAFGAVGLGALAFEKVSAKATEAPRAQASQRQAQSPADQARQSAATKVDAAQTLEVSGRVLGPYDKPFAGAKLFVTPRGPKKEELATTGDDGRFWVRVSAADRERGAKLVATAASHGPDWIDLKRHKPSDEVTLRLVKDDVPITGRVLDLEGRPVVGASVAIKWVHQVDLTPWLADPKEGQAKETKIVGLAALGGPAPVKTDKDGRFRLTGFGRDRVAHLMIRVAGIENLGVKVMARAGELRGLRLWGWPVYAPGSDFTVRPSKPIVGTVRDKKTGKPVSGIYVCSFGQTDPAGATTDEKGQYRIEGAAKSEQYMVVAGGLAYFRADKMRVADTQGLDPLTVDFELERGVVVKGRLTDKATGKPVRGRVSHVPLTDNPNFKDFTGPSFISGAETDPSQTKDDGSFAVVCVPGPGLLEAYADDADRYVEVPQEDYKSVAVRFVAEPQAIVRIEPDEKDEKSLRCDITLEPGRTLGGTVVGPDGKPLTGARAAGLHVRYQDDRPEQLKGDSFSVASLGSSKPRGLVFTDREKGLARVQVVPAGRKEPLTVRLEPTGALVGRLIDADDKPRPEVTIQASYRWYGQVVDGEGPRGPLPVGLRVLSFDNKWPELVNGQATTDKDGRFRITGLVPGLTYKLEAPGLERDNLSVRPGKDNELGDLK